MALERERSPLADTGDVRDPDTAGALLRIPWHLELGRIGQQQISIEHLGRDLVVCFDPPAGGASSPPPRIAAVQPGAHRELRPWLAPARSLSLPWPSAPLDDLWFLLTMPARRYWLEVPYGVCRAPGAHHAAPQLGPPRAPPDAGSEDLVVAWRTLRYNLGYSGGWQLSLLARHGYAGELELVASRGEPGMPPPVDLSASLSSRPLAVERAGTWGARPASQHVARYRFLSSGPRARAYVRIGVRSGTSTFALDVPTSLTERSHGSAGRRGSAR